MYKLKQIVAWVLCFAMVVALVGCKKDDSSKTDIQLPDTFMPDNLTISEEDVVYEGNTLYVDSQILLTVKSDTPYETVEKMIQEEEGTIIGFINFSGDYHVDFSNGKNNDELKYLIGKWEQKEFVEAVSLNYIYKLSSSAVDYKNDPWVETAKAADEIEKSDWDEMNPDGNNWWAEAIRMPTVWNMDIWSTDSISTTKIGILDGAFDTTHRDLDDVFVQTWQNQNYSSSGQEHGTHVAGLIGAELGNDYGIAGVASCAKPELHGFALAGTSEVVYESSTYDMAYKYALALMFENNVKVINISMGDTELLFATQMGDISAQMALKHQSDSMCKFLNKALDAGFDFLIVKAAGNETGQKFVACERTEDHPYGYRLAEKGEEGFGVVCDASCDFLSSISNPEVRSHILIVGAAAKNVELTSWTNTSYLPAWFSNTGCEVYAPGVDILSTIPGALISTGIKEGTSMATPIVTGIAGLIWSVNPGLSSKQVKDILIASASYKALEGGDDKVNIVDAAYAVNLALALKGGTDSTKETNGVLMGTVYYENNNGNGEKQIEGIPNAQIIITSENGEEVIDEHYSDEFGGFTVYLPDGEYGIFVEAEGYENYENAVSVVDGDVEYLSIKMDRCSTEFLACVNTYHEGRLTQTYGFQYDNHQRLVGVRFKEFYDDPEYNLDVHLTYTYDNMGRLIATDCENSWLYFGNNYYEYNAEGRLGSHKYYWGSTDLPYTQTDYEYDLQGNVIKQTCYYPNYESTGMEVSCIHPYTYVFDNEGRIGEIHKHVSWIDNDFEMTTEYGNYLYSEYIEVMKYTYDSDGRILSVQELSIPKTMYQAEGHPDWDEDDGETIEYFYNYPIFDETGYNGVCSRLSINDNTGHEIWSIYIGNADVAVDEDGRIINAVDSETGYRYEFIYADPNVQNNVSVYIPVVEQAISEEMFLPQSNGMLYDMDNDGIQELILIHEKAEMDGDVCIGAYHVCSVFDIENGVVITKLDEKYLNSMAGAPESYVGIVEYEGSTMFLVHTTNAGDVSAETTNTLYDALSFRQILNQKTDRYAAEMDGIQYIDMIDDGCGSMDEYMISGMPLDELLTYLKNN